MVLAAVRRSGSVIEWQSTERRGMRLISDNVLRRQQDDGLCIASRKSKAEEAEPVAIEAPAGSGSIAITMTGIVRNRAGPGGE